MVIFLLLIFLFFTFGGFPIVFSLGATTAIGLANLDINLLRIIPQRMFTGIDSFPLMAVPFFILVVEIMSKATMTDSLVRFAKATVGHITAGLAHTNILASALFAGISGSAAADAAGLGPIEIKLMVDGGYDKPHSCAVTAISSIIGPIIPPSIIMVVYAIADGTLSVANMFLGGIIPGIMLALSMMVVNHVIAKKRHFPKSDNFSWIELRDSFLAAIPSMLIALIIIGGISFGIATATEVAAIACIYALIVSLYYSKTIKFSYFKEIAIQTACTTAMVFWLIGIANAFSWILSIYDIAGVFTSFILSISNDPSVIKLLIIILLLIIGCFMDTSAAIIMIVPVITPILVSAGIDTLQFGVVAIITLAIGLVTPPVGTCLFITSSISGVSVAKIAKELILYLAGCVVVVLILAYFPDIILLLPRLVNGYLH